MMFRKKRVKVNSRIAHSQRSLKKGDVLTLELPQDKDYGVDVEKGPITVLYEDAHTLVVNKDPFMLVHPAGQTKSCTLSNYVAGYYAKKGVVHKVRPVHRLDRDTSGCILFGKTKEAQQYYTDELQAGRIDRIYTGLVEGRIDSDGIVDAPIGVDPVFDNRRVIDEFGQPAQTEYTVLVMMGIILYCDLNCSQVELIKFVYTWSTSDILSLATLCMAHVTNLIHVNACMHRN